MSKYENYSPARYQAQLKNEEFFDLHPNPWDVEIWETFENVRIYYDPKNPETILIEIKFQYWEKAEKNRIKLDHIFKSVDLIDVYRIRKKLFLRKLLF